MTSSMIILRQPTFKAQKNKSSEIDNDLRILMRHKRVVEQRVSHQQSFEIVQKLLAVSVASICYLRNLLPIDCFIDSDLNAIANDQSSLLESVDVSLQGKPRHFKVLAKGRTAASDKLLSWLDGAFDALMKKILATMQLSIILDREKPDEVVEAYTFNFSYKDDVLEAITLSEQGNAKHITLSDTRNSLNTVVRYLIQLVQTLPELPSTRYLTMHLFYTETCPPNYNPAGFLANESMSMTVPETDQWIVNTAALGAVDSGYHCVHLTALYLSPLQGQDTDKIDGTRIPRRIPYSRKLPRLTAPTSESELQLSEDSHHDVWLDDSGNGMESFDSQAKTSTNQSPLYGKKETMMQRRLRDMIKTPTPAGEFESTQELDLADTIRNIIGTAKWQLESSKKSRLWAKREQHLRQLSLEDTDYVGTRDIVQCVCSANVKEGEMVQCDCCDTWQHRHCHAIEGITFCKVHVCYPCLLDNSEEILLEKMKRIAKMRRVFWMVRHEKTPSEAVFAKLIGCEAAHFKSIMTELKDEQIIADAPGLRRKGHIKRGGARLVVVRDKVLRNIQEHGLLHPLAFVEHHFEKTKQKHEAKSAASMGPPSTPVNGPDESESSSTEAEIDGPKEPEPKIGFGSRRETAKGSINQNGMAKVLHQRLSSTTTQDEPAPSRGKRKSVESEEMASRKKRTGSSYARSPLSVSEDKEW